MAPFYAITSFLGILFVVKTKVFFLKLVQNKKQRFAEFFVLIRDIYEALLLFTFFYLMFSYLAYDENEVILLSEVFL